MVFSSQTPSSAEFHYEIQNHSISERFLSDVCLFETDDINDLHIKAEHCRIFTTGGEGQVAFDENGLKLQDGLPSVFTEGVKDDAFYDAVAGLGDRKAAKKAKSFTVYSGPLTVLQSDGVTAMISLPNGRRAFTVTALEFDGKGRFQKLSVRSLYNCTIKGNETLSTETVRIETVNTAGDDQAAALILAYADARAEKLQVTKKPASLMRNPMLRKLETAPFIDDISAPVWTSRPDFLLKDSEGMPVLYQKDGKEYRVFDITCPDVLNYLEQSYQALSANGFSCFELLDTLAPLFAKNAVYQDHTVSLCKAYRKAINAIRHGAGDSYLILTGGLTAPVLGLIDGVRPADNALFYAEGPAKATDDDPRALYQKQTLLRFYENLWWNLEPDFLAALSCLVKESAFRGALPGVLASINAVPYEMIPLSLMDSERFPEKFLFADPEKDVNWFIRLNRGIFSKEGGFELSGALLNGIPDPEDKLYTVTDCLNGLQGKEVAKGAFVPGLNIPGEGISIIRIED